MNIIFFRKHFFITWLTSNSFFLSFFTRLRLLTNHTINYEKPRQGNNTWKSYRVINAGIRTVRRGQYCDVPGERIDARLIDVMCVWWGCKHADLQLSRARDAINEIPRARSDNHRVNDTNGEKFGLWLERSQGCTTRMGVGVKWKRSNTPSLPLLCGDN